MTAPAKGHRCTNPDCDAGYKGRPARVTGKHKTCRTCRMISRVKVASWRANQRLNPTDGKVTRDVTEGATAA